MKPSYSRRYRRRSKPGKADGAFFKKESQQEPVFFGETTGDHFFQPVNVQSPVQSIQRKCEKCEDEDKKAQRMEDKKEDEDKKVMKKEDKKEEEEEKKVMKKEDKKEEEDKKLQKKEGAANTATGSNVSSYVSSLSGKGHPMPPQANRFFSSRIGYDFSNVRVHTDKSAAESARSINAKAYTIGNDIVFNEGQYDPESGTGKQLLAHELAHVVQQQEQPGALLSRKEQVNMEEEKVYTPTLIARDWVHLNTRHYANCEGVSVQGHTDANYSHSFTAPGSQTTASGCEGCTGDECVTNTGTVISTFTTNPVISLPSVPGGLSECEHAAVQNFINTTLRQHEQQHVAAFNTYRGVVRTPYNYTGCASGLDAHLQQIHDNIESARRAGADALSAALDPFNPPIPCDCPDPEQSTDSGS